VQPRYILGLARKWLWLLILASLIGGASGLVIGTLQPKIYQAAATVFVSAPNRIDYSSLLGAQQAAKAFASFPQSSAVLTAALKAVGDKSLSESQLASMITVQNDLDSQFVIIQVRESDPKRAALLASAVAKQSMQQFEATLTYGYSIKFLKDEITTFQAQVKSQEQELANLESQPPSADQAARINTVSTSLNILLQLLSLDVNNYNALAAIQVTLLQDAQVPLNPVGPKKTLAVAIGMLAGLMAIVGVIIFIEQTDDVLRTPAKVLKATRLPTFITVGHLPARAKRTPWLNSHQEITEEIASAKRMTNIAQQAPMPGNDHGVSDVTVKLERVKVMAKQDQASTANYKANNKARNGFQLPETFLTMGVLLRSESIHLDSTDNHIGSLLITSPEDRDGKTLIASQIALGLARVGFEVVLVDANLRNPNIFNIFGLSNRLGLSTILRTEKGVDTIPAVLQKTSEPNLSILTSGPAVDSPPEALSSSRMTDLLQQLSKKALVVIDSPAVLTASEAVILAYQCDSVLMVVDARHTTATKLNLSLEMLSRANINIRGVVLNQVGNRN